MLNLSYGVKPGRKEDVMTREENLAYRRAMPYDAMGDYSGLCKTEKNKRSDCPKKKPEVPACNEK